MSDTQPTMLYQMDFTFSNWAGAIMTSRYWVHIADARCYVFKDTSGGSTPWVFRVIQPLPLEGWIPVTPEHPSNLTATTP